MQRFKATIEYDGAGYAGWQKQNDHPSIQQSIIEAIHSLTGETQDVVAAGRTDAGVHSKGQVIHFDIEKPFELDKVYLGLNYYLRNKAIALLDIEEVDQEFSARFSARLRSYSYCILNRHPPSPLMKHYSWHVKEYLDMDAMQEAAQYLVGNHDFSSFRAAECQSNNPVKTVDLIQFDGGDDVIYMDITAKSFLHHMVRNIVGTLRLVGNGKWEPERVKEVLEAKDRTQAGETAPAHGLYFMEVIY